ncbi:MAG: signal peptidase II [Rhodobacteraceae bacterium PARR1]|nr:MAG: signal peptidase II [Rhodobacteraceae bacterium PARR1]
MRLAAKVAAATFLLDQVTKFFVVRWLDLINRGEIDVVAPFLTFRMAWNRGVNFGLFANDADFMPWVLIAISLVISVWVWVWTARETAGQGRAARWHLISTGLLIGGALGNVVDRILYGAVADFLNMSCCGFENPYAFNVADVTIFAGAGGLILFSGTSDAKPRKGK